MTQLRRRQGAARRISRRSRSAVYVASAPARSIMQNGEAGLADDFDFVDGNLFDMLPLPFVRGDPRDRARQRPTSLVLTETEARQLFGEPGRARPDPHPVVAGRACDHRVTGVIRDLPQATRTSRAQRGRPLRPGDLFRRAARIPHQLGQSERLVLSQAAPRRRRRARSTASCRPGSGATSPTIPAGGEQTNPGDDQDWRLVNVRDVHLGEAQQALDDARQRPAHHRHLRRSSPC